MALSLFPTPFPTAASPGWRLHIIPARAYTVTTYMLGTLLLAHVGDQGVDSPRVDLSAKCGQRPKLR